MNNPCVFLFGYAQDGTSVGSCSGANCGRVGLSEFHRGSVPIPCNCVPQYFWEFYAVVAVGGLRVFGEVTQLQADSLESEVLRGVVVHVLEVKECLGSLVIPKVSKSNIKACFPDGTYFSLIQLVQGCAPVVVLISVFRQGSRCCDSAKKRWSCL